MKLKELYEQTPTAQHAQIVVAGDRVHYDGEEYTLRGDGELVLAHSHRAILERLDQIAAALGI
jgi:hypothetical protein